MKKLMPILSVLVSTLNLSANDGGFFIDGNQLIPIHETSITVKKEMLKIIRSRENPDQVNVSVYYEFYNPDDAKTMTVGFEAASPSGDANIAPNNGEQPYLHNFTVEMNGKRLPYRVAIVNDSTYRTQGIYNTLTEKEIRESIWDGWADFMYVYNFQADFRKGLNVVKHTYICDLSTFVMSNYEFGYQLSPALRWANKQIDDFTLHIDMGDDQLIYIPKTFYDNIDEWTFTGLGKMNDASNPYGYIPEDKGGSGFGKFYIKNGYLIFQKRNFRPKGELQISSPRVFFMEQFDYKRGTELLPAISLYSAPEYLKVADTMSRRILRNIPFAARGYIFSTPEIQQYFESQIWYFPNAEYKTDVSGLSKEEQDWVRHWSE